LPRCRPGPGEPVGRRRNRCRAPGDASASAAGGERRPEARSGQDGAANDSGVASDRHRGSKARDLYDQVAKDRQAQGEKKPVVAAPNRFRKLYRKLKATLATRPAKAFGRSNGFIVQPLIFSGPLLPRIWRPWLTPRPYRRPAGRESRSMMILRTVVWCQRLPLHLRLAGDRDGVVLRAPPIHPARCVSPGGPRPSGSGPGAGCRLRQARLASV